MKIYSVFANNITNDPLHIAMLVLGCFTTFLTMGLLGYLFVIRLQKKYINKALEQIEVIFKTPIQIGQRRLLQIIKNQNLYHQFLNLQARYLGILQQGSNFNRQYIELLDKVNFVNLVQMQHWVKNYTSLKEKWQKLYADMMLYLLNDQSILRTAHEYKIVYQKLLQGLQGLVKGHIIAKDELNNLRTKGLAFFANLEQLLHSGDYDGCAKLMKNIHHFLLILIELVDAVPYTYALASKWIPEQIASFQPKKITIYPALSQYNTTQEDIKKQLFSLQYRKAAKQTNDILSLIYKVQCEESQQLMHFKELQNDLNLFNENMNAITHMWNNITTQLTKLGTEALSVDVAILNEYKQCNNDYVSIKKALLDINDYESLQPMSDKTVLAKRNSLLELVQFTLDWTKRFAVLLSNIDNFLIKTQSHIFEIQSYQAMMHFCLNTLKSSEWKLSSQGFIDRGNSIIEKLSTMQSNVQLTANQIQESTRLEIQNVYEEVKKFFADLKNYLQLKMLCTEVINYFVKWNAASGDKMPNIQHTIDLMYEKYEQQLFLDVLMESQKMLFSKGIVK